MTAPVRRIGLTGGIGSGKSTVAALWAGHGVTVIDADAIARELTAAGGSAIPALHAAFGDEALTADGALDRSRMRELAFTDASVRQRLEAVLHPLIRTEMLNRADAAAGVCLFDIPLLVERGGWRNRLDRIVVVDCSVESQVARVMQRPGWTRPLALDVIAQQATREQRRAGADAVIDNDAIDLSTLAQRVADLAIRWNTAGHG